MTSSTEPGPTGQPLLADDVVIRVLKGSSGGRAKPIDFELSSSDEAATLPSLSVWAEQFTTPTQALQFLGNKHELPYRYSRLLVSGIRRLSEQIIIEPPLDVVWDNLIVDDIGGLDTRPGALGHAAIVGLKRPPGVSRATYLTLRLLLADLSNQDNHSF